MKMYHDEADDDEQCKELTPEEQEEVQWLQRIAMNAVEKEYHQQDITIEFADATIGNLPNQPTEWMVRLEGTASDGTYWWKATDHIILSEHEGSKYTTRAATEEEARSFDEAEAAYGHRDLAPLDQPSNKRNVPQLHHGQ